MDEGLIRRIQREGAEALLDRGVSLPLKDIKFPFIRTPLRLRLLMRRPTLSVQIEIARTYLSMDITAAALAAMSIEEQMQFLVRHGKKLSYIIALTMQRWWLSTTALSWVIRHFMKWEYQKAAFETFITLMGTQSFIPIIRSVEMVNPMTLRLSHKKKGS